MEAEYIEQIDNLDDFLRRDGLVQTDSNEQAYGVIRALDGWNPRVNIVTEEYFPEAIAILAYVGDLGDLMASGVCPPELTPNAMETMAFDASAWTNKLDAYTSWETAWWREVIQNANDARGPEKPEGASQVELVCVIEEYTDVEGVTVEAMRVSATDNGIGMSEDVLRNAFLSWSGSHKPEGAVGGFGDAKELIIIPWLGYEIHTRDSIARGRHNSFEISRAPNYLDGTSVTAWMPLSKSTTPVYAEAFLDRCYLPDLRVTVNGKRRKANLVSDRLVQGFPQNVVKTWYSCPEHPETQMRSRPYDIERGEFKGCPTCASRLELQQASVGTVNVYHNPRVRRRGVLVRSNGIYMFDQYLDPSKYRGVVLVELTGPPKDLFNQKRDGFSKLTDVGDIIDAFIAKLTVDVRSALKKARATREEKKVYGGTGAIRVREGTAAEVAAKMAMDAPINKQKQWKDGSVSFSKEAIDAITERVAEESEKEVTRREMEEAAPTMTETEAKAAFEALVRSLKNSPAATRVVLHETKFASPEHAADALKLMAWQPMFILVNTVDYFNVPSDLRPEKMKPAYKRLAELWMEICRFTLMRLGWNKPFGVGWIFEWDSDADSSTIAAHTTATGADGQRYDFLVLNPVKLTEDNVRRDKDGDIINVTYKKEVRWKASDEETVKMLCAIAVHEATHMVNGIGDHDEAFAGAMTENMGALMDMLPVAKKIRKALASKAYQERQEAGPSRRQILAAAKKLGLEWKGRYGYVPSLDPTGAVDSDRAYRTPEVKKERFETYGPQPMVLAYGGETVLYDYEAPPGNQEITGFKSKPDARFFASERFVEEQGGVPKKRRTTKKDDWEEVSEGSWRLETDGNIVGEVNVMGNDRYVASVLGRIISDASGKSVFYKSGADAKRAVTQKLAAGKKAASTVDEIMPRDTGDPMFFRLWILFLYIWSRHPETIRDGTYDGVGYARSLGSEIAGSGQATQNVVTTAMYQITEDPDRYASSSSELPIKLTAKTTRDLEWDGREAWNVFVTSSKVGGPMHWDEFELKRLARTVASVYDVKAIARS